MNQVHLFKNLKTTVINLKNGPDNGRGFGANSKTRPNTGNYHTAST